MTAEGDGAMLTYTEAMALAVNHVNALPPIEGWERQFAEGIRIETGWYFDYQLERLPSNPPGPGSGVGGAPGFIITDEGTIRVVAWHELRAVRESARRLGYVQE